MVSKEYIGKDLDEVLKLAQQDLGDDFYVVRQEDTVLRKGIFKKKAKKIIAAVLETEDIKQIQDEAVKKYEKVNLQKINKQRNNSDEEFSKHLAELHKTIRGMSLKMDSLDTKKLYPKAVQELEQILKKQDTDSDTISSILRSVTMQLTSEEQNDLDTVIYHAKKYIERACYNVKSITESTNNKSKITMFIGATGIGKTTTVGKLATTLGMHKRKNGEKPVGVITIDTYREGAVEQIQNLCEYTNIPVKVANSKETLRKALNEFSDKDYIFIDTTGRSQHNIAEIKKVQDIVGDVIKNIDEIYLVMSATTKFQDMCDIYESFKWMNVNRVVFTKLDETNKFGNILSFIDKNPNLALSYLTTGQTVPTDIELVNPAKFSDSILQSNMQNNRI